ncbi:MAG: hypothetical protein AAFV80_15320, partial [Bacteroidota bacterium]
GKYASKSGSRLFIKPNVFNRFDNVPDQISERKNPIVNQNQFSEVDELVIQIPSGYEIEANNLKAIKMETPFGTYEADCQVEGEQLIYTRKLVVYAFEESADQYEAYRNYLKKVKKYDNAKVVLVARL